MDNSPKYLFKIGQLEASLNDLAYDDIFLKERDPKKREQYIKNIIDTSTKAAEDYARRINLKENTMKKSELKELLKVIAEEVIAVKKSKLDETKGLSGFKKAKESTDHTENVADSKSLTTTSEPKEKKEGKKLPVVKKPANPQKVGSIKEEILSMIREEIEEIRKKGAVDAQYRKEIEPGKWVIMGHPNQNKFPDGTPTFAPKTKNQPTGTNPNMGRPRKSSTASDVDPLIKQASDTITKDAIESILTASPDSTDADIINQLSLDQSVKYKTDLSFVQKVADEFRRDRSPADDDESQAQAAAAARQASIEREKAAQRDRFRKFMLKKRGLK